MPRPPASQSAGYDAFRKSQAAKARERSEKGRDIAPLPEVLNPERRARARLDLEFFCRTYLPEKFYLGWSADHRRCLDSLQTTVLSGGRFAFAMPRGSGKTSLVLAAASWSLLFGHRRFVVLIASDESAGQELLESIKSELENSDLLFEDFPEVCYPIRRLDGIPHRCGGQTYEGKRTHIGWTSSELVLPSIPTAPAAAGTVRVAGITGRIRGMQFARPDGRTVRPDLVIIDDPQTDESARSPAQTAQRLAVLNGAILGLAGPGQKIAAFSTCTVIAEEDLADQLLNRDKFPQWQGERTRLMYKMPRNEGLWEQYATVRADSLRRGDGGREATTFYAANREAMDEGAEPAWPVRHNPDELSAVQHAMNLKIDSPVAFAAEYQNDPLKPDTVTDEITAGQVAAKFNGRPRFQIPEGSEYVVAHIDVQGKLLPYTVAAVAPDFTGAVVDYGSYPDQRRPLWTLKDAKYVLDLTGGLEAAIYGGLEILVDQLVTREWRRTDGAILRTGLILIDKGWQTKTVELFCRQSKHAAILMPSKGEPITANKTPMTEWPKRQGRIIGDNWVVDRTTRGIRQLLFDPNHWKTFAYARLGMPMGAPGTLTLFGKDARDHELFAMHVTSERRTKVTGRGRTIDQWDLKPGGPDNHWLDNLVGCLVAASRLGATPLNRHQMQAAPRQRVKLSELAAQKRRQREAAWQRRGPS